MLPAKPEGVLSKKDNWKKSCFPQIEPSIVGAVIISFVIGVKANSKILLNMSKTFFARPLITPESPSPSALSILSPRVGSRSSDVKGSFGFTSFNPSNTVA